VARLQLFEIHDFPWCPRIFRDSLTALMRWAIDLLHVYDPILPQLQKLLERAHTRQIIDLCSGSGGPWGRLGAPLDRLAGAPVPVLLTDKYPNLEAFEQVRQQSAGRVDFIAESVDATNVAAHLHGVRTLFSSFHHFPPPVARQILRDAAEKGDPIGIFEFTERSLIACFGMLFTPLVALLVVPFLRPLSAWRILSCFPVPLLPLLATWDGFVSNLRTYSPEELDALVADIDAPGYRWQIGRIRGGPTRLPVTYLLGVPGSDRLPARVE
jgi:hypothetical protein